VRERQQSIRARERAGPLSILFRGAQGSISLSVSSNVSIALLLVHCHRSLSPNLCILVDPLSRPPPKSARSQSYAVTFRFRLQLRAVVSEHERFDPNIPNGPVAAGSGAKVHLERHHLGGKVPLAAADAFLQHPITALNLVIVYFQLSTSVH
jgi:hypothetical protein